MSFVDAVIVFVKGKDWRIIFFLFMSKDESITLLRNADWTEENGKL